VDNHNILIVEDEESLLKLESILLTAKGYRVTGASDGSEALEALRKEKPDLVLLDVMLPRLDGFEVCKKIKSNPETCEVPVVMLTSLKSREDCAKALGAGADAYLTKPFNSLQLVETIQSMLEREEREK
jgi:twitching motility two-component system response regulator PilG